MKLNHFDVFAVNFHEEFSAFDGDILVDQSEFVTDCVNKILSLYAGKTSDKPEPTSVILLGHSMGGVVARAVYASPTYRLGTVRTLLTLNTPHVIAPILLKANVADFYNSTHFLWQDASHPLNAELNQAVVLSIGAGWRDVQVHAAYSILANIPHRNFISTVATSVPNVWVSMDHDSCMWCNQLMTALSSALTALIDPSTNQIAENVQFRTKILRHYFQSNVPTALRLNNDDQPIEKSFEVVHTVPDTRLTEIKALFEGTEFETEKVVISVKNPDSLANYKLKWDLTAFSDLEYLQFITTMPMDDVTISLCKTEFSSCVDLKQYSAPMPYSIKDIGHRDIRTLKAYVINVPLTTQGLKFDILAISTTKKHPFAYKGDFGLEFFLAAQLSAEIHEKVALDCLTGGSYKPTQLISQVHLTMPGMSSCHAKAIKTDVTLSSHFNPLLMQYSSDNVEERYALDSITLKYHMPLSSNENADPEKTTELEAVNTQSSGRYLLVFSDPNAAFELQLTIDWFSTAELVLRTYATLLPGFICVVGLTIYSMSMFEVQRAYEPGTATVSTVPETLARFVRSEYFTLVLIISVLPKLYENFLKHYIPWPLLPLHSWSLMPVTWPDPPTVGLWYCLAIFILSVWSFIVQILFKIFNSNRKLSSETSDELPPKVRSFKTFFFYVPISALFIGIVLTVGAIYIHPTIAFCGALLYLLLPSNSQAPASLGQRTSIYHLRQCLFVTYSTMLLLLGPNFLVFMKSRTWTFTPFSTYWEPVTAMIWHIVLVNNLPPATILTKTFFNIPQTALVLSCLLSLFYLFPVFQAANVLWWVAMATSANYVMQMLVGAPRAGEAV